MKKIQLLVVLAAVSLTVSVAFAGDSPGKSCGQMTAEAAGMPAKVAELMTAYADEADAHAAFMAGSKEKGAAAEADGQKKLAHSYRDSAAMLAKTADAMRGASAWPAVKHDMKAMMADAKLKSAMDKVAALQKEFGMMGAQMGQAPAAAAAAMAPKPSTK